MERKCVRQTLLPLPMEQYHQIHYRIDVLQPRGTNAINLFYLDHLELEVVD